MAFSNDPNDPAYIGKQYDRLVKAGEAMPITTAPVAPSKLSAQEFNPGLYGGIVMRGGNSRKDSAMESPEQWFIKHRGDRSTWAETEISVGKFEQMMGWFREYASSSNAALQKEVSELRDARSDAIFFEQRFAQALNWVKTAEAKAAENFRCFEQMEDAYRKSESERTALEGQLRAKEESWEKEMANWGIQHSEQQAEVERLQEALRVETRKAEALLKLGRS